MGKNLSPCCHYEISWQICEGCELDKEQHEYAMCENCGGDLAPLMLIQSELGV